MNKTIALVNEWGKFEEKHPDGSMDDFCRYHLIHNKAGKDGPAVNQALVPANEDSLLMRTMGRIMSLHAVYANAALEGSGIGSMEEFSMLNTVYILKNPKKSEVIHACLHEISTGTGILNRLRTQKYLTEHDDTEDKRSKRLKITAKGEKVITTCKGRIALLAKMMLIDMDTDDKKLCIQLLKNIETKFGPMLQQHKGKPFEEIYASVVRK
ncbi:MarR family winged helix-turn-helix transcriptional regulator [Flavitalea flava]